MPELPEVETIVRRLGPQLSGKTIRGIRVFWPATVETELPIFSKKLINQTIKAVDRRGKYICFPFENRQRLTIHLRMSGKLTMGMQTGEEKHLRVRFYLSDESSLYFIDMRKFGRMRIWASGETFLPGLGPEPTDGEAVRTTLRNLTTRRPIKTVLLDQRVLAGLGNIYVDEILFASGVHPATPFPRISSGGMNKIALNTPRILHSAIANMGTTLSSYRPPDRPRGNNQQFLKVYGRQGHPCFICGTSIEKIKLSGRGTHFCPVCQPE